MVHQNNYETSFQLKGRRYQTAMHIEQVAAENGTRYRAVIDEPPLHHTYGGYAETIALALDFLNLAMQAEGADEITFIPVPLEAAG